ncbi:MAG TPA: esterase-like activity of phytase family protein [Xanthobacteraceae bacterium]|nr:esterase-like activity of phytase family protein [Xanthobacteraceae bacterium]
MNEPDMNMPGLRLLKARGRVWSRLPVALCLGFAVAVLAIGAAARGPSAAMAQTLTQTATQTSASRPVVAGTEAPADISITATPIMAFDPRDPARRQFGKLLFRGGLALTSAAKPFGGFSGIVMAADGRRFVAISDRAWWLTGEIVHDGERPAAITGARMGPVLGPDGAPLTRRGWYDTESLTADGDTLYAGIERVHRIVRFDFGRDGMAARARTVGLPASFRNLRSNRGIEGLVAVPKGTHPLSGALVVFSEGSLDEARDLRALLLGGPKPGAFSVRRTENYDISDAALLPGGDVLILERKFSWLAGLGIRLRRIAQQDIAPGRTVDGPVLFEADLGYHIDNMEGLAVHRDAAGTVVLTMISDDNFSMLQRTLLLQFALPGE